MSVNYFTFAVPVFIGTMLVELGAMRLRKKQVYSFGDTLANLACGMGSQLSALFLTAVTVGTYAYVYDHWKVMDLAGQPWVAWAVALLGVDFCYYWFHRLSHEVNFLWASHVVHHQSEEYNLSVALRQTWFGGLTSWVFYLPLAVLGVPPMLYGISYAINLLYQFIVHTKAVRTLGPLDGVLNTPSHHRVHHGSNTCYLDKNYAGILIVWDRMFRTFTPEVEPVEYGLVKPLKSFNPVWANVHYWVELAQASYRLPGLGNKIKVWFKNPGWLPGDRSPEDAIRRAMGRVYVKYEMKASRPTFFYLFLQMVLAIAATVAVMAKGYDLGAGVLALIYVGLVAGMLLWQGLLEGRPTARWLEGARLVVLGGAVLWLLQNGDLPTEAGPVAAVLLIGSAVLLALTGRGRAVPPAATSAAA